MPSLHTGRWVGERLSEPSGGGFSEVSTALCFRAPVAHSCTLDLERNKEILPHQFTDPKLLLTCLHKQTSVALGQSFRHLHTCQIHILLIFVGALGPNQPCKQFSSFQIFFISFSSTLTLTLTFPVQHVLRSLHLARPKSIFLS